MHNVPQTFHLILREPDNQSTPSWEKKVEGFLLEGFISHDCPSKGEQSQSCWLSGMLVAIAKRVMGSGWERCGMTWLEGQLTQIFLMFQKSSTWIMTPTAPYTLLGCKISSPTPYLLNQRLWLRAIHLCFNNYPCHTYTPQVILRYGKFEKH